MAVGCWCLPSRTEVVGTWQTPSWIPVPTHVPPCHCNWLEWAWLYHLLKLEGAIAQMRPRGRTHCCGACYSQVYMLGHWDVYQLHRLLRRGQCKETIEECLCKDILDSIKEHLQLKWPSTQLKEEWRQLPANTPWPDPCTEFAAVNCSMYEKIAAAKWDSYEEMMPSQGTPTNGPWWQLQSLKKEWKEWAALPDTNAPAASDTLTQEVQVLGMSKRRSPGDFLLCGTQSHSRRSPGDFPLQGHHSRVDPVP